MNKSPKKDYQHNLAFYDQLIATHSEIERKGKTMPYTSHNGHMFTFFSPEGVLGIRLSDEDKEVFEKKYGTGPFIQYRKVMRGYVPIPQSLLEDTKKLEEYLDKSYSYIKTLKPKPTKKK